MQLESASDFERNSFLTHLARGNFHLAENKIDENINQVAININQLQKYSQKIKVKTEEKGFITRGSLITTQTGKIFEESFILLKDYKNFKFSNKKEKLRCFLNIEKYEQSLGNLKKIFESLSEKLKKENAESIYSERSSIIKSRRDTIETNQEIIEKYDFSENLLAYEFKENLDNTLIEERGKQILLITKIMENLNCLANECNKIVINSGDKIDDIEDNIVSSEKNMKKALVEIKTAEEINRKTNGSDGFFGVNKIILFLICFVSILFVMALSK